MAIIYDDPDIASTAEWKLKTLRQGKDPLNSKLNEPSLSNLSCVNIEEYKSILAIILSVNTANEDPMLLPNHTLGYHLFNTCENPQQNLGYALKILSGNKMEAPNYYCREHGEVAGFIGDTTFHTSRAMAQLLSLYQYTQINYQVADPFLRNKDMFPTLYQMTQYDSIRYTAIVKCLLHFGWNWVGVVAPDDGSGDTEFKELTKMMTQHGICTEYILQLGNNKERNIWRFSRIQKSRSKFPESRCNDRCRPGYRKVTREGTSSCCYDCVRCSEGEVSNVTDSENCFLCPDEEWPDKEKVRCLSKAYDFLSYENDALTLIFALASLVFSAMTLFILGIFIHYWNTPVVKANNRTVSFILLTSILLSFLCVFLFLGRPVDITCMLRQVSFGVFFTISVSCVLAKTVTVCIAFKATKPGSYWRKWATIKLSNSLVFTCSSIQALICVIWLSISPPYHEYDMFSVPGNIINQCNEGSVIGFYSVLGYMGFLAAVSFLLAFMVRTLPDSFNEAKYITFSMLVFCSVWIAMIPAYLSTRGKYMVAVEIFAILASSVGLLGCIFFPKCYVILFKHELNISRSVHSKRNQDS
ncbi:vomeronasal type-2 receptor 26-like [Hyperolius riggenbachi]|uniref:vomeronasal type-2 receptor 26-like n=1 Tax=Hyperolius riggenbachi TaxID=752182 RepID=UPI0035A30790